METGSSSFLKRFLKGLSRILKESPMFRVGFSVVMVMVLLAVFEHSINSYRLKGAEAVEIGLFERFLPPSFEHPLGTEHFGRDVFALTLSGLRYSLGIGAFAGGTATMIGVIVAIIAGYKGGIIDALLNAVTNFFIVIPTFPILIAITAFVRVDLILMALILATFSWSGSARMLRAQILSAKESPYIDLAKVSGLSDYETMFMEILPNLIPYIVVGFSNAVVGAIMAETGLRMMGMGPAEIPTIGYILNISLTTGAIIQGLYQLILAPAFVLIVLFVAINLMNVGLEKEFNPRLKEITGR